MDLSHVKVLVTGGAGIGVGYGVCQSLHKAGAQLIINDIDPKKLMKAVDEFEGAVPCVGDIRSQADVERMFADILTQIGPINGLVNNAGVGLVKAVHDISEEEFDKVYDVNVKGMWRVTKYFVKQLLDHNITGNIVNVSSIHASASQPNYSTYASSKNAVEGLTRTLAFELGQYNIRCNAIAPGMVHAEQNFDIIKQWADDPQKWVDDFVSDQQVLHHYIQPIDCGHTVSFLLSDYSRSITGQTICVDAGTTVMLFNKAYVS